MKETVHNAKWIKLKKLNETGLVSPAQNRHTHTHTHTHTHLDASEL